MKYEYTRSCKCGNVEVIEVTKREAAFNLKDKEIWNMKCSKCGETKTDSMFHEQPEFSKELLLEWGNDADLFFIQQDEDISLADTKYMDLIFDVIDNSDILLDKRNILIGAMCIIVFDYSHSIEEEIDKQKLKELNRIMDKVINELIQRKQLVIDASDAIMGYIKIVVFPKLEIEFL